MELTNRKKEITELYSIEPQDVVYCDLIRCGWGKFEAIYLAYNLAYFDSSKINQWYREHTKAYPGVIKLLADNEKQDRASAKELRELKDKIKQQKKRTAAKEAAEEEGLDPEKMSKEELGRMYCQIMRDKSSDDKTRMDAAKAYSSLYQLQKEQDEEEDNRISFYLPVNCHYCDRCKTCGLKGELESLGYKVRAKKTSPYLWQVVRPSDDDTEFIDPVLNSGQEDSKTTNTGV